MKKFLYSKNICHWGRYQSLTSLDEWMISLKKGPDSLVWFTCKIGFFLTPHTMIKFDIQKYPGEGAIYFKNNI